jgi:hypothetical protein
MPFPSKHKAVVQVHFVRLSVVLVLVGSTFSFGTAQASVITPPSAPTILQTFSIGKTYMNFRPSSSDGGSPTLTYSITAYPLGGVPFTTEIGTIFNYSDGEPVTQYEILGLSSETSYTFSISAYNGYFYSNDSGRSVQVETAPAEGWYLCSTGGYNPDQVEHLMSYRINEYASVVENTNCEGAVIIRPGILAIEEGFVDSSITSVTIPESVEYLDEAFKGSTELSEVIFLGNSQLSGIGYSSFEGTGLTTITIPSAVEEIDTAAFQDALQLEEINFAENSQLEEIGNRAFQGTNLETITIPSTVEYIGEYAFRDASQLDQINFADNSQLEFIDYGAFRGTSLNTITIPASVTQIVSGAFMDTASLTSIEVAAANGTFRSVDGVLFRVDEDALYELYKYPQAKLGSTYTIPDNLQGISFAAFADTDLSFVNIPSSVNFIYQDAFKDTVLVNYNFCNINEIELDGTGLDPELQVCYRNWQTPLASISNGPKVGETIYASAFERELPRSLFKQNGVDGNFQTDEILFPSPEEYVYRITKTPNDPATSVDHQTHVAYESLTSDEQSDWYDYGGFGGADYRFSWHAFMCVLEENNIPVATKPTGLTYSYASREDGILSGGSLNAAHNLMFKNAAQDWIERGEGSVQTELSVVGTKHNDGGYTQAFLGESDGFWYSYVWGILEISASCGEGETFKALRIAEDQNSPITTKNFTITETLYLVDEVNNIFESISSEGITIGVTGGALLPKSFNAALWGLTTIADSSTPPAPPSGGGGSSTQTPTPTPSATTSPRATQSANPIIQNRLVIPTQLKPGTTNNPEPLIKKLIEDVSNSLKPIIVNIFTQQSPTPNPFFDSKRALEVATPARDKKVIELPSLVRIDNELQSSKLVVIDNTSVQVVTEGGGMLSVEAKDGVATIPVDNTGKVQMIRSNTVNTNGVGLLPNSEFAVYLFSEPTLLGIGKSDLKGNFYASFMVDKEFPLGNHTLQVNGILSNGKTSSISMPVTVVENADIAHSQATPKSNLVDENPVTKANSVSYLIIAIFILLLIIMLFGGSRLFLVAGRRRQED